MHVAAREKEKAPGPCELRALLRDAPSMHEARAEGASPAPPDLAIRQRRLCSGARPSAQPYVACRDEIGIASDRFKAGNDRNASPGELDFMHGGMTRRHEGSCERDAHRRRFEYGTGGGSTSRLRGDQMEGARRQARQREGFSA